MNHTYILPFTDISAKDVPVVGGKGANLGELTRAGLPVPPGYCLTADAYRKFIRDARAAETVRTILEQADIANPDDVELKTSQLRDFLIAQPMPDDRTIGPVTGLSDPMQWRRWQAGGHGMVSTIGDYARFAQMLLNRGSLDGKRYLKPETVALMTSDQIGPETHIMRGAYYYPGTDSGFGLGFAVRTMTPPNTKLPIGEYRWDGAGGTFFFVDPRDDMFAICMMQSPSRRGRIESEMKTLIYDALVSR